MFLRNATSFIRFLFSNLRISQRSSGYYDCNYHRVITGLLRGYYGVNTGLLHKKLLSIQILLFVIVKLMAAIENGNLSQVFCPVDTNLVLSTQYCKLSIVNKTITQLHSNELYYYILPIQRLVNWTMKEINVLATDATQCRFIGHRTWTPRSLV